MTPQALVQLFYNSTAGGYSPSRIAELADALRETGARVRLTPSSFEPPVIDPAATHVCVAGGDGTVRHVAAAIADLPRSVPIAIYPAGTINLLARETGIERRPTRLARSLLSGGTTRRHNPVRAGDAMFFACASVGPDSFVVASLSTALKRRIGRLAYVAAMARLLWLWPRHRIALSANGETLHCEAAYIAKGRYYAGPWSFAPGAKGDDAHIHIVALRTARRRDFASFCWRMLIGADMADDDNVISFRCTELSLHSELPLPLQADGDIVATCPIDIAVQDRPVYFC